MFSYNMTWSATKKEVERSNFFKEGPKILKRFWFSLLVSSVVIVGVVIVATPLVPIQWRIGGEGWAVIFPLLWVAVIPNRNTILLIPLVTTGFPPDAIYYSLYVSPNNTAFTEYTHPAFVDRIEPLVDDLFLLIAIAILHSHIIYSFTNNGLYLPTWTRTMVPELSGYIAYSLLDMSLLC